MLALFWKWLPKKALRLFAQTRFATNFFMIDHLLDYKQDLQIVVIVERYMTFELSSEMRKNGSIVVRKAKDVRVNIYFEVF